MSNEANAPSGAARVSAHLLTNVTYGVLFACLGLFLHPRTADARIEAFSATGSMTDARFFSVAVPLSNGKVLVVGGYANTQNDPLASAELYDPTAGVFNAAGPMTVARAEHTATPLPNGKVLVAGGVKNNGLEILASAELYDPATGTSGTFAATGSMTVARYQHTATLLPNGKVLIMGGYCDCAGYMASAELYDPATGTFTATGSMTVERALLTATLLPSGKVLVVGGGNSFGALTSAELYDPATGTFSATGSTTDARTGHAATLLLNGKVLVTGGYGVQDASNARAELYDPATGTFAPTGSMAGQRVHQTATLLPNGMVLVAGGWQDYFGILASAELYDPATETFSATGSMIKPRNAQGAALLPDGRVLVVGGVVGPPDPCFPDFAPTASAELFADLTPAQAIGNLAALVTSPCLGLSAREQGALLAKLNAALGSLQGGNSRAAANQLGAFINQVNALVKSRRLTAAAAAPLLSDAQAIIDVL